MRREERNLNVPVSPGAGDGTRCDGWIDKWVQVEGTFTGTVKVQGRLSSESAGWVDIDTAAGGVVTVIEVRPQFYLVRLDTTGVLTGTPAAQLVGLDRRTDV